MRLGLFLMCLFALGCSSGGFVLNGSGGLEDDVDMALFSLNDENPQPRNGRIEAEETEDSVDFALAPKRNNDEEVQSKPESRQQRRVRTFGKRVKSSKDAEPANDDLAASPSVIIEDINNKVDMLFVVDGSFSMKEVLRSIPERMDGFIPALDSLDWRAGFISAHVKKNKDMELSSMEIDGAVVLERKYITRGTVSKERIFIDSLTRNSTRRRCAFPPACGGFKETPLLALNKYITSPLRSAANGTRFIRDEAHLAVVILTDNKENKKQGQRTTADEVINTLQQEFGLDKEFSVHVLAVTDDACRGQLKEEHFFAEGRRSAEMLLLSRETGGSYLSLCSYDYAVPLAEAITKSVRGEEEDCSACVNASVISDQN